jgi:hypothetical protein
MQMKETEEIKKAMNFFLKINSSEDRRLWPPQENQIKAWLINHVCKNVPFELSSTIHHLLGLISMEGWKFN